MSRLYSSAVIVRNYRLFVPKTFRSQERKVPMENFRSPGRKVPGTFVPVPFRSRELSFPGNESSWELSFLGPFVPGNFRSHYPIGLVVTTSVTTQDKDGNMLTAHTDLEKAEVLGNFFASVFNRESEFAEASTTHHITSHWDDRCRPPRPMHPRNKCLSYEFIIHKIANILHCGSRCYGGMLDTSPTRHFAY